LDDKAAGVIYAVNSNGLIEFALLQSAVRMQIDSLKKRVLAAEAVHFYRMSCIEPVKASVGIESGHKAARLVATAGVALDVYIVWEQTNPGIARLIGKYTSTRRHDNAVPLILSREMTFIQPRVCMKVDEAPPAGPAIDDRVFS
jgi:hypothetical protein